MDTHDLVDLKGKLLSNKTTTASQALGIVQHYIDHDIHLNISSLHPEIKTQVEKLHLYFLLSAFAIKPFKAKGIEISKPFRTKPTDAPAYCIKSKNYDQKTIAAYRQALQQNTIKAIYQTIDDLFNVLFDDQSIKSVAFATLTSQNVAAQQTSHMFINNHDILPLFGNENEEIVNNIRAWYSAPANIGKMTPEQFVDIEKLVNLTLQNNLNAANNALKATTAQTQSTQKQYKSLSNPNPIKAFTQKLKRQGNQYKTIFTSPLKLIRKIFQKRIIYTTVSILPLFGLQSSAKVNDSLLPLPPAAAQQHIMKSANFHKEANVRLTTLTHSNKLPDSHKPIKPVNRIFTL